VEWTADSIAHVEAMVDFLLAQHDNLTQADIPALYQALAWQQELLEGAFRTIGRLRAELGAEEDEPW
jgi:hypothetical protein